MHSKKSWDIQHLYQSLDDIRIGDIGDDLAGEGGRS
jgi:hypothetical protein